MKDNKKVNAGKIGSSVRWKDHEKIKTTQVRIFEDDYFILSRLSFCFGSVGRVVHCALVDSGYNNLSFSKAQARFSKEL